MSWNFLSSPLPALELLTACQGSHPKICCHFLSLTRPELCYRETCPLSFTLRPLSFLGTWRGFLYWISCLYLSLGLYLLTCCYPELSCLVSLPHLALVLLEECDVPGRVRQVSWGLSAILPDVFCF